MVWNNSFRVPPAVAEAGNVPGSVSTGACLINGAAGSPTTQSLSVVASAVSPVVDGQGFFVDFDIVYGYENSNFAGFLIRATAGHTYVLQQEQVALGLDRA